MHLAAFAFLSDELERVLRDISKAEGAEVRLAGDGERYDEGGPYTIELLIGHIVQLFREVLARHEERAEQDYANDRVYKGLVQEMMDARTWAESLFRLYLEDTSRGIWWRMNRTSLREGHRELVAFRTRALQGLEGKARLAAAEQLCLLRGFAAEHVSEANDAGEDALVCAAADGAAGASAVELLLAAGAVTGGEALVAAATHGQSEALAALLGAGVDVNSRAQKVLARLRRSTKPALQLDPGPRGDAALHSCHLCSSGQRICDRV
jgi:hypothetical protein